ncbi:RluA family pseudouridine synthase [bacterium]|nr:RluA family pseudouridine synthase [bacterium]MCI0604703.1 RluA family pseudouridine synthase [bacterium]
MKSVRSFVISVENAGIRIDRFLTQQYSQQSRSAIQKWFETGLVHVNDQTVKASYRLRDQDRIEVLDLPTEDADVALSPWNFPLEILFEDQALLAINKPAHMVVHPGAGVGHHTVVHAALHHFPGIHTVGHPLRPGIVHRLDKETSGILLLAKTQEAYLRMTSLFKDRLIRKHYRAAVFGQMERKQGRIEKALGRDPSNRKKISVRARRARPAVTLYSVLQNYDFGSLLDVEILTGRTHQIRVHLSSEKHPILGDAKYGGGNWNRIQDAALRNRLKQTAFFGLHAFSLEFDHPMTGKHLYLEAPLPEIWTAL